MNAEKALEIVEKTLLQRQLTTLERLILLQSWQGLGYHDMAQNSGYGGNYFKEVGCQLWHCLSEAVGRRVTKKNLQLILKEYNLNESNGNNTESLQHPNSQITVNYTSSEIIEFEIQYPGSPLSLSSPFYINRPPVEKLAYAEIDQPGCILLIKAPKGMGKSSLLNQVIAQARKIDYKTVYLDFQEADDTIFTSLDKFLRWFASNVSRQLKLTPKLDDYWDEDIGSKVSCKMYFEEYLLRQIDSPLVLALNEVNLIFEYPNIFKDFFPMLRFWHEMAQQVEIWQKLRLVVAHSTESYIPLKLNQSPFNVGLAINLPQFTLEQVQELAQRYGLAWRGGSESQELMKMVGGHPYLVNMALYHLSRKNITLPELLQTAATQSGIYSQHLRSLLTMLLCEKELAAALQRAIASPYGIQLEAMVAYKLESVGLIKLEGNLAILSCQLYRLYFFKELKVENSLLSTIGQVESAKQKSEHLYYVS
jgi:AAA-like domain